MARSNYVSDVELYSLHDRLNVLGAMHTDVVKEIMMQMKSERGE